MPTVGQLIIKSLIANDVDRVFCVPGESYLGLLDGLYEYRDDIDTVVCRHEAGAGFMALADARLSGVPGVACVSRGPGASNAAIAVHTSEQDGVPFLLFVGDVAACDVRRDAFQEIDYGQMYGGMAKWTAVVTDPDRIPETVLRAIRAATTGVPGPVVISVPEDVLTAQCDAEPVEPQAPVRAAADPADVAVLTEWLAGARRPLVLAGGGLESDAGRDSLLAFLEAWELPAVVSFRRQDLVPNDHRLYAGDMGLKNPDEQMALFRGTDLLLVLGARLSDITTQGYSFPRLVSPEMKLAHVHCDPAVIGTHFAADLAIVCDPKMLMDALVASPAVAPDGRREWIDQLGEQRRKITEVRTIESSDGVPFEQAVDVIGKNLPRNAIVTLDAGSFGAPAYRLITFAPPQRLLAPISGAMGFGIPAAVAAALRCRDRPVFCLVGDGGMLMTGGELAVAMDRGLALKVILADNNMYGSVRIHQERDYPGRPIGTDLTNPDFEMIGRAFGFNVTRISAVGELDKLPAILDSRGPEFVVVSTSVEAVLPRCHRSPG
ncbi:MAG: thiamine pyrophosphate-dependent enzyme [Woeseia sp.]